MLGIRAEDLAADEEYAAMLRCTGLARMSRSGSGWSSARLAALDLDGRSGIILGGGPFQVSDPEEKKPAIQLRVEAELAGLLDDVVERDHPFLGSCYGIVTLGRHQGAVVVRTYGEPIGGVRLTLTSAGSRDPLFSVAGATFGVYLGHKEAITKLPAHAVALASSRPAWCRPSVLATGSIRSSPPELDLDGPKTRVEVDKYAGHSSLTRERPSSRRREQLGSPRHRTPGTFVALFGRN